MALRAAALRYMQPAESLARPAVFLPRDRQRALAAAHRVFEAELEGMMQIGAADGRPFVTPALALADDIGEQIAERRRRLAADADREIETFESVRRGLG